MKNDKPILPRPSIRGPSRDRHQSNDRHPSYDRQSPTPTRVMTSGDSDSSFDISQSHDDSKNYQGESRSHTEYKEESYHSNIAEDQQKHRFFYRYALILISLLMVVFAYAKVDNPIREEKSCPFSEFEEKYSQNEKSWLSLRVGIENIMNGQVDAPAIYLFLHNGNLSYKVMISNIAEKAASCLGGENVVKMDNTDFTSKEAIADYGYVVQKYKHKIKEGNVVMIVNLNEIPAEAAVALHPICDTVNPIIKKVVILMTLSCQESSEKPVEAAENTLYELWGSKIKNSSLGPLVTRLIDQVIAIK